MNLRIWLILYNLYIMIEIFFLFNCNKQLSITFCVAQIYSHYLLWCSAVYIYFDWIFYSQLASFMPSSLPPYQRWLMFGMDIRAPTTLAFPACFLVVTLFWSTPHGSLGLLKSVTTATADSPVLCWECVAPRLNSGWKQIKCWAQGSLPLAQTWGSLQNV